MTAWQRIKEAWRVLWGKSSVETLAAMQEITVLKERLAKLSSHLAQTELTLNQQATRIRELEHIVTTPQRDRLEEILRELVGPLSQLRLQAFLLEKGGDISSRSIMALARQVMERLERTGLEVIGAVGEEVSFDPQMYEPLNNEISFIQGDRVVIRFVGYRYQGAIMRRALVEKAEPR